MRCFGANTLDRPDSRRGGALLFSLIVVMTVSLLSLGLLQLTNSLGRRQKYSVEDKRAFYVAEAGLAEAYYGLSTGGTGDVGSITAPVTLGGGLVWVEATEEENGNLRLTSNGLHGAGRSTLEIVVEPIEEPFGIFSDGPIEISEPVLIDGYDSDASPYDEQVVLGKLTVDPVYPYLHDDTGNQILFYEGLFYRYQRSEGNVYRFDAVLDHTAHPELGIEHDDFIDDWCGLFCGDFDDHEYESVLTYFAGIPQVVVEDPEAEPTGPASELGPTTGGGGLVGSNGSITLSDPTDSGVEIFGDLAPGPGEEATVGESVLHTGEILARAEPLVLAPVSVPDVELLPGFIHDSAIVRILPPADIGYESIEVRGDSQVTLQGPGTLVVNDFTLRDGATLLIENDGGSVNVYVLNSVDFRSGSRIDVTSQDPSKLSIQVAGPDRSVTLAGQSLFHGMVYAPESEVSIGDAFEIFGSLAAGRLVLAPGARLHFDSGTLGDSGAVPLPKLVGWRIDEVPTAIKQRTDPFKLLDLDEDDLLALGEEVESESWEVEIDLFDASWIWQGKYEGPIEDWQPTTYRAKVKKINAPQENAEDWRIDARWKDGAGAIVTFNGPLSGFPASEILAVYEWNVTGPGETT